MNNSFFFVLSYLPFSRFLFSSLFIITSPFSFFLCPIFFFFCLFGTILRHSLEASYEKRVVSRLIDK